MEFLAVGREALVDLAGQFTGGAQHQRAGMSSGPASLASLFLTLSRRRGRHVFGDSVENRHGEGTGLACARLGAAQDVASLENDRDRLLLDWGWFGVALEFNGAEDGLRQLQILECHVCSITGSGMMGFRGP